MDCSRLILLIIPSLILITKLWAWSYFNRIRCIVFVSFLSVFLPPKKFRLITKPEFAGIYI